MCFREVSHEWSSCFSFLLFFLLFLIVSFDILPFESTMSGPLALHLALLDCILQNYAFLDKPWSGLFCSIIFAHHFRSIILLILLPIPSYILQKHFVEQSGKFFFFCSSFLLISEQSFEDRAFESAMSGRFRHHLSACPLTVSCPAKQRSLVFCSSFAILRNMNRNVFRAPSAVFIIFSPYNMLSI